jgi:U3 small nucleolar RNA-associated protein 14
MSDILASLTDPSLQSFRKSLAAQQTSKSKSVGQKLDVPLAKPIKERLERQAAYEETKREVSKWQPLVKANREADHLEFPLNEPPKQSKQSSASLAGTFEVSNSR